MTTDQTMIDTSSLAARLGVSPKTIGTRAKALGIVAMTVSQGAGRPKAMWSPEQAAAIAAYGKPQESQELESLDDVGGNAAAAGYLALQTNVAMPLGQQLTAYSAQLEHLEDQAAIAVAHRTAMVLPRTLAKAAQLMGKGQGFNIADVAAGALGIPDLTPKPIGTTFTEAQKRLMADRF